MVWGGGLDWVDDVEEREEVQVRTHSGILRF